MAIDAPPAPVSTPAVRHSMAGVLAEMSVLAAATRDAGHWAIDERRGLLADLDRAIDGLTAVRAAVLVAERESGTWQGGGDRSFESWRSRAAPTTAGSARTQVREAEQLHAVPAALDAVTAGRITMSHATALARVAGSGTPAQRGAVLDQVAQEGLLELAERTDAGTFATAVARWAATVDPAGLERDHQAQRAERFLHLSETPSGAFVKGRLDSMAGHRLALALEALTPRPAADDDRDPGQRRADALDTMVGRILADADTKPGGHVPPHVSMIVSAETWDAARAERDRRRAARAQRVTPRPRGGVIRPDAGRDTSMPHEPTRSHAGHDASGQSERVPSDVGPSALPPATLEDGRPVPPSDLAVAMCDCAITRIVVDAAGAPLDLGRTARVFSGPQRRAVTARDRECIWPDCHMAGRWCHIHHTRWWERDGGTTAVDQGVLLCSFHHHEVHRRDLAVVRLDSTGPRGPAAAPPSPVGTVPRRYEIRDRAGRAIGTRAGPRSGREPPDASRGG